MTDHDTDLDDELLAQRLYEEWDGGTGKSKSQLEIEIWGDATAHGRHFDRFVRKHLGVSTSRPSRQTNRIAELEDQIRSLGEQPTGAEPPLWEVQAQHARAACLEAVRIWNDPTTAFRTGAFSLLFVAAWNSLAIAVLEHRGEQWWNESKSVAPDTRYSKDIEDLVADAFSSDESRGLRANIRQWCRVRNEVAHRHLPVLDALLIPSAQAGLLNFEESIIQIFGESFALAASLVVPVQLSGFRNPDILASRKKMQEALPLDVQAILNEPFEDDPELLGDRTFQMRVAFVPVVPASGRNPDAVSYFVNPDSVPTELEAALDRYVVLPKVGMSSRPNFSPTEVIREFERRTGLKMNTQQHADAGRALGARPKTRDEDHTVDLRLAEYITSFKRYLYSQAWIDLLVEKMGDPAGFLEVSGQEPRQVEADLWAPSHGSAPND